MASTRRLAAIRAADVASYSRLMGADEEGTHERLKVVWGSIPRAAASVPVSVTETGAFAASGDWRPSNCTPLVQKHGARRCIPAGQRCLAGRFLERLVREKETPAQQA